jgi:hypothetical protein
VRIEEGLPYAAVLLAAAATWASVARPAGGVERTLKALALLSLAVFAFLRGVAPSTLSAALILSALNHALPPARERPAWASGSTIAGVLAWVAFAWLLWREGLGPAALEAPAHLALVALAAIAAVGVLFVLRDRLGPAAPGAAVDLSILGVLLAAAFTLPFELWPAMAGALALVAAEVMTLDRNTRPARAAPATERAVQWLLAFGGQAAIASIFLR